MRVVQQEFFQPALLVTATDPPDGGPVTLQPRSNSLNWFPGGNSQDNPGMLDLEPSQAATAGHGLQDRAISISNGQGARFASTHGTTSDARTEGYLQHTPSPEFVASFMARPTSNGLPIFAKTELRDAECIEKVAVDAKVLN